MLGAVALDAAIGELSSIGWDAIAAHDRDLARRLRSGLAGVPGVRLLGPDLSEATLPLATFTVDGVHHALVAARLSAEYGIGVRHGCFCAHPYLLRLLGLSVEQVATYRESVLRQDRREMPGAVRASAGLSTSLAGVDRLVDAVAGIASGKPATVPYVQDPRTGDFWPEHEVPGWAEEHRALGASCARG